MTTYLSDMSSCLNEEDNKDLYLQWPPTQYLTSAEDSEAVGPAVCYCMYFLERSMDPTCLLSWLSFYSPQTQPPEILSRSLGLHSSDF